TVSWSATEYVKHLSARCTGKNKIVENKLLNKFPSLPQGNYAKPMVIRDSQGNILLWYLPSIFTMSRAAQMWKDLRVIQPSVKVDKKSSSWRVSDTHYRSQPGWLKPGNVSLAPAWFQQAHENSDPLEVSTHLVKNHSKEWLTAMEDAFVIIGAILSIIHPEQFKAGCETLELLLRRSAEIRRGDELVEIIPLWGTPFSVIS
ncbi:hypothetical protein CPB83DRAFT_734135, partial [Crepidotus variabilis]